MIAALAGGVGAAKMLRALCAVVDPSAIVAVVNTGDDTVMHGLHVSPDIDTVVYTLAGVVDSKNGWGLESETWAAMEALRAYGGGRLGWFNLGDRDLGTHMYRTSRLAEGATLRAVTAEIAARWRVGAEVLPMSDETVETRVVLDDGTGGAGEEVGFQEYFVGMRHSVAVHDIHFHRPGAHSDEAPPAAPGVIDAISSADGVVICPSNPIVSIGPILRVAGVADAVIARRERTVAVSPIIAGKALKGPADRMLSELGHDPSVVGVARLWAPLAATLVIDEADRHSCDQVEAAGMHPVVAPTIMSGAAESEALARVVLAAVGVGAAP